MRLNKKTFIIITGTILVIALLLVQPVRLAMANQEAEKYAKDSGLTLEYPLEKQPESKETFLRNIYVLAAWADKLPDQVNQVFGFKDDDLYVADEKPYLFDSEQAYQTYARKCLWRKMKDTLTDTVYNAIDQAFGGKYEVYGINQHTVEECYDNRMLGRLVGAVDLLDQGDADGAYEAAMINLPSDETAATMDIIYGLNPDAVKVACSRNLETAENSRELDDVEWSVKNANFFADRYAFIPENLDTAKDRQKKLEYECKPDTPEEGMYYDEACDTKLGYPDEVTHEHQSWSHEYHTMGNMTWYKDGDMIFYARYLDDKITSVSDYRNEKPHHGTWHYSSGSNDDDDDSSDDFDADDYDIDSYYEDHEDEYEDYEDAEDGIEDDPDAEDYQW